MKKTPIQQKNPFDMALPIQIQIDNKQVEDYRKQCSQFGLKDNSYNPEDTNCILCSLSLVCCTVRQINHGDELRADMRAKFDNKPFYGENLIKDKFPEFYEDLVFSLEDAADQNDPYTYTGLNEVLPELVKTELKSIDPKINDLILKRLNEDERLDLKNGFWNKAK